mgnify:CR=1 FL=1
MDFIFAMVAPCMILFIHSRQSGHSRLVLTIFESNNLFENNLIEINLTENNLNKFIKFLALDFHPLFTISPHRKIKRWL